MPATLSPLLVTEVPGHLGDPVILRPRSEGGTHLVLAKRVLAASPGTEETLGKGEGIEEIGLFDGLHDGPIRTRAIAHNGQTPYERTELAARRALPGRWEGTATAVVNDIGEVATRNAARAVIGQGR